MFVAVWDQSEGTSTSRCSKITEPLSLPIVAVRSSQFVWLYGVTPGSSLDVKNLENDTPVRSCLNSGLYLRSSSAGAVALSMRITTPEWSELIWTIRSTELLNRKLSWPSIQLGHIILWNSCAETQYKV